MSRRYRLAAGLAFLTLVPVLLAALTLWFGTEYRRLGTSEDEVQRAHARQLRFAELLFSLKDAETGQRGFVITGSEAFLSPYREGRRAVQEQLRALRFLPASAAEARRLKRMDALIAAKFEEMERVLDLRRTQGLAAAAALVGAGQGRRLMDDIREEGARARAAEAGLLAQTLARQHERTRTTQRILWGVVAVIALTFAAVGVLFWRSERQRAALERAAAEAAARRRAIFDGTLDAIVLINPSGSIETINRAAVRLFGYEDAQLIRRDISLIVDLAPGEGPFLDRIGLGPEGLAEPFRHRLPARRADGTTIPVEAALGVMPLPDGVHIVAALRDVSEREKAERIKDQFLSTVSHELRTPLTSIVGALGLLRGGVGDGLSAGAERLLAIAGNNAERLIRLVNDLLDIEKLEAGEMAFDFRPVDLRDVAARSLDAMRGMAQSRDVALEAETDAAPVMVRGDAERLIQVFANLLGNAIRFSPAGHSVTLAVRRRASHAEASVTDRGPGVDAELRGRLFTRFAQSIQAPPGHSRGTGLGLAISREIVRRHGGDIRYDPAPGRGSVFSFHLPLWNAVTDQREACAMPLVLHVDDDTDTLEITAAALAGRARMARAADIASARALIARDRPDLVIVDLALPDGSGEDLLAELALCDPAIPVIIYSAQERNGDFAHEVSAVLTKSKRSLSTLIETIDAILPQPPEGEDESG